MQELKVFQNEDFEVRSIDRDGQPWFVGKDVAEALGYRDTINALKAHVDEEDKKGWQITTPSRGLQTMTIINESGVYSLIFSSKLPKAKEFKRWVTNEVLPSIRRNGYYSLPMSTLRVPEKDFHYWVNLPEDSEDFKKILKQEYAKIGYNECKKKARVIAKADYREYHASSPILVGSSERGYELTREAQERVIDFLNKREDNKVLTLQVFINALPICTRPSDIEIDALNRFIERANSWEPEFIEYGKPLYKAWQRV